MNVNTLVSNSGAVSHRCAHLAIGCTGKRDGSGERGAMRCLVRWGQEGPHAEIPTKSI